MVRGRKEVRNSLGRPGQNPSRACPGPQRGASGAGEPTRPGERPPSVPHASQATNGRLTAPAADDPAKPKR